MDNIDKNNVNEINDKLVDKKFYQKMWFIQICLILITPVGIILLFKYYDKKPTVVKVILSMTYLAWFFGILLALGGGFFGDNSTNDYNRVEVVVEEKAPDFATMSKNEVNDWCEENDVKCIVKEEYSDEYSKGELISNTVYTKLKKISKVELIYSLGKK